MSALTLGSTMGVLTWMFVDGHGSGVMNYTPQPLMAPMIGLIIAVIYGLSTDYEGVLGFPHGGGPREPECRPPKRSGSVPPPLGG